MLKEKDHLFTSQIVPIRVHREFEAPAAGADQQSTHQIQSLVMVQAGAQARRVPAPSPAVFERRHQAKATFIFQNQPSLQFTTLFLSLAEPASSTARSVPRRVGSPAVAAAGCSTPCGSATATRRWVHSALQTTPKSHDQSVPVSNSLQDSRAHRHRATVPSPASGSVSPKDNPAFPVDAYSSSSDAWPPLASAARSDQWLHWLGQLPSPTCPGEADLGRVAVFSQAVRLSHRVS